MVGIFMGVVVLTLWGIIWELGEIHKVLQNEFKRRY